ncbi:MAG: hypothetical protein M5R36_12350 [Deltaproteobacteria bacterium]|nr:hypothetical protein [Deltaproteobacteria bacterium]
MYFNEQDDPELTPEEQPEGSTFYLMQAALHAKAQLLPIFQVVYSYDAAQNAVEAFGLIDELPGGLYLKAGRFILPYGLRFDDHTIFTRAPLGFHNISQDSGVEIGVRPGPAFLVASLTNGNMGEQAMDRDKSHYAFTTQGGVRFWKIGVGGSYFLNNREGFDRQVFGPWATFGWGPVALLAEFDVFKQEVPHETRPGELDDRIGSGSMAQADVKVIDGLYVQGRYSHMDTDWEVDETFMDQWAGGLLVYPIPYLQLQAQYRWNREPDLVEYDNNQVMIQGHFFF